MNANEGIVNEDIRYIDEVNAVIWKLRTTGIKGQDPIEMVTIATEKAIQLDYKMGIAQGTLNLGMGAFIIEHDSAKSLSLLNKALQMFESIGSTQWIANAHLTLAIISTSAGKPETAYYHCLRGIPYYETKDNSGDTDAVMAYYVTGTVFKDLKKFSEAESWYNKGLDVEADANLWSGRIYTSLANIYNDRREFDKALEFSARSLKILENEKNAIGISRTLNDMGVIERNRKNFKEALEHFSKSLEIREQTNMKQFVLGSLIEIAQTYFECGDEEKATTYFLDAEKIALEIKHESRLILIYTQLAALYKKNQKSEQAIVYFEKLIQLNHELHQKERESKIENFQNSLLREKEQEIERLRNVELKEAYDLITEKNKEITDSIQYAQRIQKTLLASEELLSKNFSDYFVLFKPKDIVSGDFYWATSVENENVHHAKETEGSDDNIHEESDLFFLAVCDSTGHGVPGAFMSLLNITFLNEAINQKHITEPGEIFDYVRTRLINSVSQDGAQDGMDGTLISISRAKGKIVLKYASANNQAVFFSAEELKFLSADKMPVGKGEKSDSFTTYEIQPEPGDVLYLFTDGYPDQFGGPKGKKFRYRQLEALLQKVHFLDLKEQHREMDEQFSAWKGSHEQVDDVLVIGIRF